MKNNGTTIMALMAAIAMKDGLPPLPYSVRKYIQAEIYLCKYCGKEFKSTRHNRKTFCSAECYKAYDKSQKDF